MRYQISQLLQILGLITFGIGICMFVNYALPLKCHARYPLINKDIACGNKPVLEKTGYAGTQLVVQKFIETEKTAGKITGASVYFRDLENGPVFGVNELDDFIPASLLKLPVALAFLSEAERNPALLSKRLVYPGRQTTEGLMQLYRPTKTLETGAAYDVKTLLEYMLIYSDNAAYEVLENYQYAERPGNIEETYLELGVIAPQEFSDKVISVRRYASLFRVLYNASYLNADLCELLLSWLAESDFDLGLTAGVPANVAVANKFGERTLEDGTTQLHDCGIVYYPGNPYLLCVMTSGTQNSDLASVISTISRTVYVAVHSRSISGGN